MDSTTQIDTSIHSYTTLDTTTTTSSSGDTTFNTHAIEIDSIVDSLITTILVIDSIQTDSICSDTTITIETVVDIIVVDSSDEFTAIPDTLSSDTTTIFQTLTGVSVSKDTSSTTVTSYTVISDTVSQMTTEIDTVIKDPNEITNSDLFGTWSCTYYEDGDKYTEVYSFNYDQKHSTTVTITYESRTVYSKTYKGGWAMANGDLRIVVDIPYTYTISRNGTGFKLTRRNSPDRYLVRK